MSSITVSRCRKARIRSRSTLNHFISINLYLNLLCSSFCALCAFLWLNFFCALRGLPDLRAGEHESVPTRLLCLQLFATGACQFVKLRLTSGIVYVPARRDPTLLFNAIERWIQ